jgi:hypothetical protein
MLNSVQISVPVHGFTVYYGAFFRRFSLGFSRVFPGFFSGFFNVFCYGFFSGRLIDDRTHYW